MTVEYFLNSIYAIPTSMILNYAISCMITVRYRWAYVFGGAVVFAIPRLIFGGLLGQEALATVMTLALLFGLPLALSSNKLSEKFIAVAMIIVVMSASEIVTSLL